MNKSTCADCAYIHERGENMAFCGKNFWTRNGLSACCDFEPEPRGCDTCGYTDGFTDRDDGTLWCQQLGAPVYKVIRECQDWKPREEDAMNEHTCENCGNTDCEHAGDGNFRINCKHWKPKAAKAAPRTLDDILEDYVSARRKRTKAAAELEQSEEAVRTLSEELREALEKVLS